MTTVCYRRSPNVLGAPVGTELIALDRTSGELFELSDVAASTWLNLDRSHSVEALLDRLVEIYDVPKAECAANLTELLADLQDMGLIEPVANLVALPESEAPALSPAALGQPAGTVALEDRLRLCVACCRWAFAGDNADEVRALADCADWSVFLRHARYHRIQGLAWKCLSALAIELPAEIAAALRADAHRIAGTNLRSVAECAAWQADFASKGLEAPLFLKGVAVGRLAYDDPFAKMGWDIDILVAPGDLSAAIDILRDRGFEPITPGSIERLQAWHTREKESVWGRPRDGLYIELHTRLADNLALVPTLSTGSPRQAVSVTADIVLQTFADDELFAYLAVHGASSAWFRLKWISDFAALLLRRSNGDADRLFHLSQELGAGRAMGQALLLADTLFGSLENAPKLRATLQHDRSIRRLTGAARQLLTRDPVEPTERRFGTLSIHWTQFLLLPGFAFKLSEFRRQAALLFNRPG